MNDEQDTGARLLKVAREDHAEWMAAFREYQKHGNKTFAELCLSGANTVEQLIQRMERELRRAREAINERPL